MEASDETTATSVGALRGATATVAVLAACAAAFLAFVTNRIFSTDESYSHETSLLVGQLVIAIAGLLPAGLFARALIRRRDSQAVAWLVIGLLVYLGWGVLNDAAVHGWAHMKVF